MIASKFVVSRTGEALRCSKTEVQIGRDYGGNLEVISGLELGDVVITNSGDAVVEGVKIEPVHAEKASEKPASKSAGN